MVIQVERLWLFETLINNPFYFNKIDGIEITMSESNDRRIELLDLEKAIFYVDTVLKGGLNVNTEYGGEDHLPITNNGKTMNSYSVQFNIPLENTNIIEQMIGKEFSLIGMRRDLSFFACFARFIADDLDIDNEVLNRVTLESELGNEILFELNNFNVTEVVNIIGSQPPIYPPPFENVLQTDYPIESLLN